ncbi:MAG: SAM-dependent methyltransferase [Bacteroidales bacterium]|nr:SAM-dependent methyltransferase [Bacteroidales bacterium]
MRLPTATETEFIEQHLEADGGQLALRLSSAPANDRAFLMGQISGHQCIRDKIPSWYGRTDLLLPPALALEQCSSERTARYKASLCAGQSLCDLTGGFGVDFTFMAPQFERATYVERQPDLCRIVRHNANALGMSGIEVCNADAADFLARSTERFTCIFIDPARRDATGGKVVLLEQCQPNLAELYAPLLGRCHVLLAKLSPMLDISAALRLMPQTADVHVVAVGGECKELLFVSRSDDAVDEPNIHCINLLGGDEEQRFVFTRSHEQAAQCGYADRPLAYLYEPNAAILKAGAFRAVAQAFALLKLHPHSHLYTADTAVDDFPGRRFRVVDSFGASTAEASRHLADVGAANIATRNFPESVAQLRRRLRLDDGGEVYLFATTLAGGQRGIVRCAKG